MSATEWEDTVANRITHWEYTGEQVRLVQEAMKNRVPKAKIMAVFYPDVPVQEMQDIWREK